jgi:hypothetical protein
MCTSESKINKKFTITTQDPTASHRISHLSFTRVPSSYLLFPKVIAGLVRSNGVSEFHVALTQGLWRYDRWGMPIVSAPSGSKVWAWFQSNEQQE